ncbi:hypothetical protein Pint_18728 [Pistacia integerrima]|uniref:Uncharacterized protein n=1 Tax=Pistacia integerrima TaxID=434235 RepID=A0ACC0YTB2_9ROSI|nr:hypothetical protein Pint_18728 [Pistacia integerrima]
MRLQNSQEFDYPGCPTVYEESVKAVMTYQKKADTLSFVPKPY